ncbi:patatin-like phospholipase family protein [Geothrix fuzhouensis]|uniref:patatin-like phospholipase family protein n=1 Tax=Geothrix fuzhouensis TaxID=2966451 RepID=UPI0021478E09|nr:patatin-like phospholipase family protein [Geothrix fuzhouensis]
MPKPFRILSIDGGGVRGLIPALVLGELERQTGRPISDCFDLITGTSTGGILALGLAMPGDGGRPRYSAQDLAGLYVKEGGRIFDESLWRRLTNPMGLRAAKYPSDGIEGVLAQYFGESRLKEALVEVLVTAYDLEKRDAFFYRRRRAREDARYDVPMRVAARATSAAPTYFEPLLVSWPGDRDVLVDGGVFANNPAMCAYAEGWQALAKAGRSRDGILLVSLGTGLYARPYRYEDAKGWGVAGWARPVLDVIFDGVADTVDYQLRQLLPPAADGVPRYLRFQADLDAGLSEMDDTSPEHLEGLHRAAESILQRQATDMAALVRQLAG